MKPTRLLIVIAIATLSACATEPLGIPASDTIKAGDIESIKVDVTSRTELIKRFGEPEMKIPTSDGMTYFWKDPDLNSLWVLFSEDWTVQDYEWSE